MLRYLTAGETHGKCLSAIIEGMPSNININEDKINALLKRRQEGYGRGNRMKIETDTVEILSGVRGFKTLGSPIALQITNRDFENWQDIMSTKDASDNKKVTMPRPGHADLSGAIKYDFNDIRNVLERASARETAIRVAVGGVCLQLLEAFNISVTSKVISIGEKNYNDEKIKEYIEKIKEDGDSLGGIFEIRIKNAPVGLGSYVHYDRKLDARLSMAIMSIQAIKAVSIGIGFEASHLPGSKVHDEIFYEDGYKRKTNNAGGIEGGMSNGEDIVIYAAMKPIPTLYKPLQSVDFITKEPMRASVERSDACAVEAAAVVGEACAATVIAEAFLEKFGGDSYDEIAATFTHYNNRLRK